MKESPQMQKLEQILRSSKLAAGGFMGDDLRSINEIISVDSSKVSKLGYTIEQIASRMQAITDAATMRLGTWAKVDENHRAVVEEAKGALVCPWPHPGRYAKRVTTAENCDSGEIIRWSDLNIHLIAKHGFFEGRGAAFRIEPEKLINVIF
ncbi:MAG: hypothetical protein RQ760_14185 [Sedimentisphaerales bacterium]|nr:hypothetical protein [Sedimentisphaerales bacterium]